MGKTYKYPQPPFKKYVKLESGKVIELAWRHVEPAAFKGNGMPNLNEGWEVMYDDWILDAVTGQGIGIVTFCERIVATADSKDELV